MHTQHTYSQLTPLEIFGKCMIITRLNLEAIFNQIIFNWKYFQTQNYRYTLFLVIANELVNCQKRTLGRVQLYVLQYIVNDFNMITESMEKVIYSICWGKKLNLKGFYTLKI